MDLAMQVTMIVWRPEVETAYVIYILSGMYGLAEGNWNTQVSGEYFILSPGHNLHLHYIQILIQFHLILHIK